MGVLREFLRPRWIVLGILVIAFAAACFTVLAPWQLGKNATVEQRIDRVRHAAGLPAVPLDELQPPGAAFDPENEWRQVTVPGRYLTDDEILLRRSSAGGREEIVTSFQVAGTGRVILVDRGVAGRDNGSPAAAPTGELTIHGRLRGPEPGRHDAPRVKDGRLIGYALDTGELGRATGLAVEPFYVELVGDQPGALGEIPLPPPDPGPYFSYGLQWIAFGVLVPVAVVYFAYKEVRRRRYLRSAHSDSATGVQFVDDEPGQIAVPGVRRTGEGATRAGKTDARGR